MSRFLTRPIVRLAVTAIASAPIALALAPASPASAAWTLTGHGTAGGAATVMPTGAAPSGTAGIGAVTVSWPAVTLPGGAAVTGYVVNRYSAANGTFQTVNPSCSGTVTTTTCTERPVPAGTWVYTDTPVLAGWTGGESPAGAPVTVNPT